MKRICILAFAVSVLLLLLSVPVSAHSGKTDASGGHYDSSTGEYHYHHGYPAHQHTNGKCPYDYKDKTDHSSGSSSNKSDSSEGGSGIIWIILPLMGVGAIIAIIMFFRSRSDPSAYSQTANNFRPSAQPPKQSTPVQRTPTVTPKPPIVTPKPPTVTPKPPTVTQKTSTVTQNPSASISKPPLPTPQATDDKKKIQELESKIKDLTGERDKYKKQVEDSSKPVAPSLDTSEALQLKTRIKDLQDQNKRLQDQNKQLREQNEKQTAQISALGQAAQPEPKYSDDYVLGLEKKISTLEAINDTHKKTINSLKSELTNARKSSHSSAPIYNEEREFLEGKIDSLKEELKEPTYFKNLFTSMLKRIEKEGDSLFYNYPSVHLFLRQVTDKRFHRAMIEDMSISGKINVQASIRSSSNTYTTSLQSCGCEDFRRNNAPCKHMMFLSYHTGVLLIHKDEVEKGMKKYISELQATKPKK